MQRIYLSNMISVFNLPKESAMPQISITTSLSIYYRKHIILADQYEPFIQSLQKFKEKVELIYKTNETEEHLKGDINHFFKHTFYQQYLINTSGYIDMAIYLGEEITSPLGVLIEVKKPSNITEFPNCSNLNKKAMHELVLYYFRERMGNSDHNAHKNNNIKQLIITNGYEWFFFKGDDFYQHFYKNSALRNEYEKFASGKKDSSNNALFYNEIAKLHIETIQNELPFVYLDLRKIDLDNLTAKEKQNLYKIFSPTHILNLSFGNDSNQLNRLFYNELLHIIGLEESKHEGKNIIGRKQTPHYGSLLENTIFQIEDKGYLRKIKSVETSMNETGKKSFNAALELCLVWINRILFLKLLEAQLISHHPEKKEAQQFLNSNFIQQFDDLNDLFFSALAKHPSERHESIKDKYHHIPYLNSSLFEPTVLENESFDISALKNQTMPLFSQTILKDHQGKRLSGHKDTLAYLFAFLDAYDFSASGTTFNTSSSAETSQKSLINASVLGLIFEKLNGYKDGSFYTPSFITMYMSAQSLRRAVVNLFKTHENSTIETFDDCIHYAHDKFKKEDKLRLNTLINSLKICDPAVGSGHFLVSALNELIAIKSELGILVDTAGNRLRCDIYIKNDELNIIDEQGDFFVYLPNSPQKTCIQKTLFHEKQTLIENCLFGVDLNPNSVKICRLRLWIELLKNAYYMDDGFLQTLPNIDINIKQGNSLISRFTLDDDLKTAFKSKSVKYNLTDYKNAVRDYKYTNNKDKKYELIDMIEAIKNNLSFELAQLTKLSFDIFDTEKKLAAYTQQDIFNVKQTLNHLSKADQLKIKDQKLKDKKKQIELSDKLEKFKKQKAEIDNNQAYRHAFEWRFEFPEVLDDEGNFIGFDVIIGNPPYIQMQSNGGMISDQTKMMNYQTFERTGDIYALFYEKGTYLLAHEGSLNFITSNKWMRANYGKSLRSFLTQNTNTLELIDFGGVQMFDEATVDTNILHFEALKPNQATLQSTNFKACLFTKAYKPGAFIPFIAAHAVIIPPFKTDDAWGIMSPIAAQIKQKIEHIGKKLIDWDISINFGIKTGFNEAFIISADKRAELITKDAKNAELIKPILRGRDIQRYQAKFADLYLINCHNGLKEKNIPPINIDDYPSIKEHLNQFIAQITKRADQGITPYNLRNCAYLDEFSKENIVWKRIGSVIRYSLNDNSALSLDSTCFLTGKNIRFLLTYLNSKLGIYQLLQSAPKTGTGDAIISVQALEPLLIPNLSEEEQAPFITLANQIINAKSENPQADTSHLENEIDQKVYALYGLNDAEIQLIEG